MGSYSKFQFQLVKFLKYLIRVVLRRIHVCVGERVCVKYFFLSTCSIDTQEKRNINTRERERAREREREIQECMSEKFIQSIMNFNEE